MTTVKAVKVVKVKKTAKERTVSTESFTFDPARKKIKTFINDALPTLDGPLKNRYSQSLESIYDSKNGKYHLETEVYRVIVEISNAELQ